MKLMHCTCAARLTLLSRACLSILFALSAANLTLGSGSAAAQATPPGGQGAIIRYVKGRLLVQPRAGLSEKELDNVLKEHGAKRALHIKQINVYVVELPPQASEVAVARALTARRTHFKFAELDRVIDPTLYPNDPYYGNAWHLPKIGAPTAWDYSVGLGATIAILDSGVDGSHPDLAPQMVPGWNFYDNSSDTADVYGHGTKVAGAASAAGNNLVGVTAVTWRAKIMPIRVTDTLGYGYYSFMAQGLVWAADQGARVANISFLGVAGSSTVLNAAQYMRGKGGVVVVSGGNTGALEADPPSDLITAVSATDASDNRPTWSSYGAYIDVAAPGVGIWTTTRGGGYDFFSGTSAASPVTAGVYALMIAANPALQPPALDSALFSTALDLGTSGYDQYFGWGRINASAAVAKAKQTGQTDTQAPTAAIAAPTGGKISGLVPIDATATDNVAVARVELLVNGTLSSTETVAPYSFALDTSKYPDGALNLQAKAYDAAGNSASSSTVAVTVANDTIAPTVTIQNPLAGSTVSGTVPVSVSATDNQKVSKISLTIDGKEVAVSYGSTLSYSWAATSTSGKGGKKTTTTTATSSTLTARAEDPAGNFATKSITVSKK